MTTGEAGRPGAGRTVGRRGQHGRLLALLGTVLLLLFGLPGVASANAGAGSSEARVIIQEAVGFIANGAEPAMVLERIDDVLKAPDQAGVDAAKVEQAKALVEGLPAGAPAAQADAVLQQARQLLESAVTAPAAGGTAKFATGTDTGTTVVLDVFKPAWGVRGGGDVVLLGLGVISVLLGLYLARRLRPQDSIRDLRRRSARPASPKEA
ncbi:MAG: hypothetical protein ACOYY2_14560 [Actinomycetota bacterium]